MVLSQRCHSFLHFTQIAFNSAKRFFPFLSVRPFGDRRGGLFKYDNRVMGFLRGREKEEFCSRSASPEEEKSPLQSGGAPNATQKNRGRDLLIPAPDAFQNAHRRNALLLLLPRFVSSYARLHRSKARKTSERITWPLG